MARANARSKANLTATSKKRKNASRTSTASKKQKQCDNNSTNTVNNPAYIESDATDTTSEASDLPSLDVDNLEPITVHGKTYYKAQDLARGRKMKKRTSHIWLKEKGFEIVDVEEKKRYYYCCECLDKKKDPSYVPLVLDGNSSAVYHWHSVHSVDRNGNPVKKGNIAELMSKERMGPGTRADAGCEWRTALVSRVNFARFKLLLIQWIVYCHIAFSQIENEYFRGFLSLLHEGIASLIPGRKTIRKWIIEEFATRKRSLRHELRKARSNIHLSFDLWTSPNCYAIMAICGHYIDRTGARKTTLLAMRRVEGEHSGENMAAVVLKVIREYRIGRRIGYFMLDNASSNDTCVDCVLRTLFPHFTKKQRERRRLRCLGHVINLAAQTFLLGTKAETTIDELEIAYLREDFEKIAAIWKRHGALGRLHNIIRYIRMTPQRREEFRRIVIEGQKWEDFNKLEVSNSL